ncbi:MAG: glycosyl hydrolase family 16 [Candidatus Eisenbacteria bacterium]|uniref:Glycosyl hydrolase family 16 n=1 Tax=Eiseniibacteriota bacterium TaxID=2212470 RepID=A0A956NGY1_UNCEI|nr:glycosyl hydrolase family 16 [Candidatus Eisenbacteria bacterium]
MTCVQTRTCVGATLSLALVLTMNGCTRDTSHLEPIPPNTDPIVFSDALGNGVDFQAFLGSDFGAISVDPVGPFRGQASLKVTVPNPGNPDATYAGGAFPASTVRDLSGYDALTFWARASRNATLDIVGLGNDNTGTSRYDASWSGIPLTTSWTKYVVPIPLPSRLASERGLFYFAEGPEAGSGYEIWFDEIQYERVGTISNPRPSILNANVTSFLGSEVSVTGTQTTFDVGGSDQTIAHSPDYMTFSSSDEAVAVVDDGVIRIVGGGTATITGRLGDVDATGAVTIDVAASPTEPAPTPQLASSDVLSLFSDAYSNLSIDTWSAAWDRAEVVDLRIDDDNVKAYTQLLFAGVEFISQTIDASEMTHFHADLWIPAGNVFRVKLVDFGADGEFGGTDDREHELSLSPTTDPALETETWVSLDIPLERFTNLTTRAHLAQLIFSGNTGTAYLDNIYFHR